MKTEKLIIVGKTASGKDFLLKEMIKTGLPYFPKFTSRPKRQDEVDGVNYQFITNEDFDRMLINSEVKVSQKFEINGQTWNYGITCENFDKGQLFIMTPHEVNQLKENDRKSCFIVYLDIDPEIRKKRLMERKDNNDSIERRMSADEEDFSNFVDWDLKITDPEFESDMVWDLMN